MFVSLIRTCRIGSDPLCCEGFLPLSTSPYQNFLILTLMEVSRHVYMTNWSYIYFLWLKAWGSMIFHWWFDYDGWSLIFPIPFWSHELTSGWIFLLWIPFDGMFIVELIRDITHPSKVFQVVYPCLSFSPFQWPFSPFKGLWFSTFIMRLV